MPPNIPSDVIQISQEWAGASESASPPFVVKSLSQRNAMAQQKRNEWTSYISGYSSVY